MTAPAGAPSEWAQAQARKLLDDLYYDDGLLQRTRAQAFREAAALLRRRNKAYGHPGLSHHDTHLVMECADILDAEAMRAESSDLRRLAGENRQDTCPYCGNDGCTCSHKWGDSCRCAAGGAEHDTHHCSAFQRWLRPEPPREPK